MILETISIYFIAIFNNICLLQLPALTNQSLVFISSSLSTAISKSSQSRWRLIGPILFSGFNGASGLAPTTLPGRTPVNHRLTL